MNTFLSINKYYYILYTLEYFDRERHEILSII